MSSALKHRHYTRLLKLIIVIPILVAAIFMLIKGNFLARVTILTIAMSGIIFKVWVHRSFKAFEYDEIGYWSGLDDFEPGIDLHCFDDLDILDDDFESLTGDYYDRRPI
ncbi:MAG: hypothetical protein ACOYIF_12215 [Acetivibrionales bacterium]